MGKARILEAHGEGRYTIEIIEARERAEFAKQEAEARIQTLRANITSLEQRIASAQATVNQAAAEQDTAINHYQQEMAEQGQSSINLDAFSRDLLEAASQRDALQAEQRTHELRIAADEALVARINALPPLRQMQAWCADYTEDLSGEVATAEVPGEIGSVIIKPGFEGNAWSAAEDGAMQPTLASTPAATFYNLAMLPGWQKWRPTFRTATITRLEGDTCSITLDAATSSQQGLGVNARASYSNVPILYMDCNGSAFEEGDQVLVAFAGNVEGPTVVGFEQAPKACDGMVYITTSTAQWDKPAVNYALAEYYEHSWLDPDVFGLPVASGSYQIHKQLVRDNLEASVAITHNDSWAFTHSLATRDSGLVVERRTNTWSISHECHVSGKIKHFGRDIPIQYLATLNKNFSVSRDGYEPTDPSFFGRPKTLYQGFVGGMMEVNPSEPFLDMYEAFTLGGYAIDLKKISDYIAPLHSSYSEWITYYPVFSIVTKNGFFADLNLRGHTKPFNILLPDMVGFKHEELSGITMVFSSTGQPTYAYRGSDYYERFGQYVPYLNKIRSNTNIRLSDYDPSGPESWALSNRLTDAKLHVYVTLIEQDGEFARAPTPEAVMDYYKRNKIRGRQGDVHVDMPVSISV